MNKKLKIILIFLVVFIVLGVLLFFNFKENKDITYIQPTQNISSQITSQTATSTDQVLLSSLKDKQFAISGAPKGVQTIGDIILTKELAGNTDIITYTSVGSDTSKKFYLLQIRKNGDQFTLISSSLIDGAKEIIGLRAADTISQTEYYIEIQFQPANAQNETQGVIKTISSKGIQEDTTL
jgi:uncharacterized protein YxeA